MINWIHHPDWGVTLLAGLSVGVVVSFGAGCGEGGGGGIGQELPRGAVDVVTVAGEGQAPGLALPGKIDFNRDIRPILAENCYACHGPDAHTAEADVQLHTFELATKDGFAIVPGDPESSEAWVRINDARRPMPPKDSHKKLTDEQKALIGRWIEQGAEYMPHWAYVPPQMTELPEVQQKDWPVNWVDQYTLAKMQEMGLEPAGDADKATLLRRVSYDLTGLPPTTAELDAFINDKSPDAYEKQIDRLLASPHFGERMAIYWLDLVRFADTVGYHGDQTQSITPYRDWVIWAFNKGMPYDEFIKAQLAGDLIDPDNTDMRIASAYNRLQKTSHEGGVQLKEYAALYDADRVRNVSEAFMGASIGCAQCHDHKYDPYTAKDFYSLAAFFADIDDLEHLRDPYGGLNRNPTPRKPEMDVVSPLDRERKEALEAQLAGTTNEAQAAAIRAEIASIKPRRVMVSASSDQPREVRLLPRGDWQSMEGPVTPPAVPAFMGVLEVEGRASRLDLANWMTRPVAESGTGELTARVMANRLWGLMFGEGLCTSLLDFGGQGVAPNHPELLDRLALSFVESGWDIKLVMKTLAMSRTYRQSSVASPEELAKDPMNYFFARQTRKRLSAEMIRDTALSVSGLLVDQIGGESAHPYQPAGYYQHLNFPQREYKSDTGDNQWRRGVYVHWQRQFLHPMFKAFDAPTREECTAQRPVSNNALAALSLLNDPTFVEASRAFAQRVLTQAKGNDRARIIWAFREATAREPDTREVVILSRLLGAARADFKANPGEANKLLSVGLSPRDQSLDPAEHAAWTEVCRAILNLHETISRS